MTGPYCYCYYYYYYYRYRYRYRYRYYMHLHTDNEKTAALANQKVGCILAIVLSNKRIELCTCFNRNFIEFYFSSQPHYVHPVVPAFDRPGQWSETGLRRHLESGTAPSVGTHLILEFLTRVGASGMRKNCWQRVLFALETAS